MRANGIISRGWRRPSVDVYPATLHAKQQLVLRQFRKQTVEQMKDGLLAGGVVPEYWRVLIALLYHVQ